MNSDLSSKELTSRLREHAKLHYNLREQSEEQALWADDLRVAADEVDSLRAANLSQANTIKLLQEASVRQTLREKELRVKELAGAMSRNLQNFGRTWDLGYTWVWRDAPWPFKRSEPPPDIRELFNSGIGVQNRNRFSFIFPSEAGANRAFHYIAELGNLETSKPPATTPTTTTCGYCSYEEADGELIEQCAKCKAADAARASLTKPAAHKPPHEREPPHCPTCDCQVEPHAKVEPCTHPEDMRATTSSGRQWCAGCGGFLEETHG